MIVDKLENAHLYEGLNSKFPKAFATLKELAANMPEPCRHEVEDGLFALVQSYQTRPADAVDWECHKNYIDIQYVASGTEAMGWAPAENMRDTQDYNPEKDVQKGKSALDETFVTLHGGMFAIFFPHDGHKPTCTAGQKAVNVEKIVVKVAAE